MISGISAFIEPETSRYTCVVPSRRGASVCHAESGRNGSHRDFTNARRSEGDRTGMR